MSSVCRHRLIRTIFGEQQGITLLNDLKTDTGTISAGTVVDSYFFAVNANDLTTADTRVTFSGARALFSMTFCRA